MPRKARNENVDGTYAQQVYGAIAKEFLQRDPEFKHIKNFNELVERLASRLDWDKHEVRAAIAPLVVDRQFETQVARVVDPAPRSGGLVGSHEC